MMLANGVTEKGRKKGIWSKVTAMLKGVAKIQFPGKLHVIRRRPRLVNIIILAVFFFSVVREQSEVNKSCNFVP